MTKILFLYHSQDGQTQKIVQYAAQQLTGVATTQCLRFDEIDTQHPELSQYAHICLAAPIRYGHFPKQLTQFIEQHASQLNTLSTSFISVNLTARKSHKSSPDNNGYTAKFLDNSAWKPTHCAVIAGALRYPRYHFFDKRMIQFIMWMTKGETDTRKEVEYTNWQSVDQYAKTIQTLLA